jgi:hypothetical protein
MPAARTVPSIRSQFSRGTYTRSNVSNIHHLINYVEILTLAMESLRGMNHLDLREVRKFHHLSNELLE